MALYRKVFTFRAGKYLRMKKFSMLRILMIALFVIGYSTASAQGDYVVTIKRDTLWGKVKHFTISGVKYTGNKSTYVQLTSEGGKKTNHDILKTISFRMNGEIYNTVKFFEDYTFMKLIRTGYLSLYGYQMENQTGWDGRFLVKKDGAGLDVPNIGFKKRIMHFLEDCPQVTKDVESGALGKSDLLKIVNEYNACIQSKTKPGPIVNLPAREAWTNLENEVKALPEFDKKADALEMINEVLSKLSKSQSIPSFLISGLKDVLKDQSLVTETLTGALEKLN